MYTPFKVLRVLWKVSLGTTHNYIEEVECPDCGHIFTRKCSDGCFHNRVDPFCCPKCGYPWNKEEYNPSKRLN